MGKIGVVKKNKFIKLLRFGFYSCLLFSILFFIDTEQFYVGQLVFGFLFGVLLGILEELTSHRRFVKISLPLQFVIKIIGIAFIVNIMITTLVVLHPDIEFEDLHKFVQQKEVTSPMILAFIVATVVSTYFQIERLIGKNMLSNYLRGKYRRPKKEIRVFLFLDLKGSTTISEKLGNDSYYSFLNDAIYEMSESIIENRAEIYQYVGDEIVFSWPLEKGITNNRCLRLYEKIVARLEHQQSYFQKHYGYKPVFKGALHAGLVLAAEIGHIKKNIIYSGDVLNATARMESLCNNFDADLLISKSLFNLLDKKHEILYEDLGAVALRGKDEKIELLKIHVAGASYEENRKEIEKALKATS